MIIEIAIAVLAGAAAIRLLKGRSPERIETTHYVRADQKGLEHELALVKRRLETLERITVERENSLAREIEDLRRD